MKKKILNLSQLEHLSQIFRILFNNSDMEITDELTAQDVSGWDSFNHINLIINIENEFNVRFTNDEVASMEMVGDLKRLLAEKLS